MTDSGLPESFGKFYAAEFTSVLGFLLKQGANLAEAQDAAQDAFLELLRHWGEVVHPRAWVRVAAKHAYERRQIRGRTEEGRAAQADWAPRPVYDKVELPEQEARVLRLIVSLPPRQRAVFALHFDGFSHAEIAQMLEIEVGAVAANLYQARQTLKRALAARGGADGSAGGPR